MWVTHLPDFDPLNHTTFGGKGKFRNQMRYTSHSQEQLLSAIMSALVEQKIQPAIPVSQDCKETIKW